MKEMYEYDGEKYVKNGGELYHIIPTTDGWMRVEGDPVANHGHAFYSYIKLENMDAIYDVNVLVEYDTGFEDFPTKWNLVELRMRTPDSFGLIYAYGHIPGWTVEDQYVCHKYVKITDFTRAWMEVTDVRTDEMRTADISLQDVLTKINGAESLVPLLHKYFGL